MQTALAAAAGASTVIAGPTTVQHDALGATTGDGVTAQNSSTSSVGTPVQVSPTVLWEGHGRVSGSDATMQARIYLVPRTSGNVDLVFEARPDGGAWTEYARITSSESNLFVPGILLPTVIMGGLIDWQNGSYIGRYQVGGGGLEVYSAATADPLWLYGEEWIRIQPHTSVGGPYELKGRGFATLGAGASGNVLTLTPPANAIIMVCAVFLPKSSTNSGSFVRHATFDVASTVVTQRGTTNNGGTTDQNATLGTAAATIDTSGGDIRMRGTADGGAGADFTVYATATIVLTA